MVGKYSQSIKDRLALIGWRVLEQLTHCAPPQGRQFEGKPYRPWTDNHTPNLPPIMIDNFSKMFTVAFQFITKRLVTNIKFFPSIKIKN